MSSSSNSSGQTELRKSFMNYQVSATEEIVTMHFTDGIYNVSKKWANQWLLPGSRTYNFTRGCFTDIFRAIYIGKGIPYLTQIFSLNVYKAFLLDVSENWTSQGRIFLTVFGDLFDYESNKDKLKNVASEIIKMQQCKDTHSIEPEVGKIDINMSCFWYTLRTVWPTIIEDLAVCYKIVDYDEYKQIYKEIVWPYTHA